MFSICPSVCVCVCVCACICMCVHTGMMVEALTGLLYNSLVVSGILHMNEVNPHWARLVLGWMTIFRHQGIIGIYHLGM